MTIHFDKLPDEKPGPSLPEAGKYLATITGAEMKNPKQVEGQPTKAQYLALTLTLQDENGNPKGKIYDNLTESDSEYVRYKLKRFIIAMEIPVTATIELKDIAKIVKNKQMWVDVMQDLKSAPPKGQVDMFGGEIYYPLDKAAVMDTPVNAPDATDAPPFDTTETGTTY